MVGWQTGVLVEYSGVERKQGCEKKSACKRNNPFEISMRERINYAVCKPIHFQVVVLLTSLLAMVRGHVQWHVVAAVAAAAVDADSKTRMVQTH